MEISGKAVRAVIILENNHIILIKRNRDGNQYYTIPGGHIEPTDKTPITALKREIREELSIEIEVKTHLFDDFMKSWKRPGTYKQDSFYLCKYISGEIKIGTGEEFQDKSMGEYAIKICSIKEALSLNLLPEKIREYLATIN